VIVTLFLDVLNGILGPLVSALPDATIGALDSGSQTFTPLAAGIAQVDQYVPILAQLHFLLDMLSVFAALLAFRLGVFVWRLVRG
jgi:hypothetical protein